MREAKQYNLFFADQNRFAKSWDENLLKYYEKALNDPADKKLIFLHLNGSHFPINLCYPPEFEKFTLPKKYYDKRKAEGVCLFDNSIYYTDYLLNKIIALLEQKNEISAMLYLSDHGQDVNDTPECILTARTWPNGYEVPFIVWVSKKYRENNTDFIRHWNTNCQYVTDKTAYSLIDLARMSHPSIDLSKSIFHNNNKTNQQFLEHQIEHYHEKLNPPTVADS